MSHVTRVFQTVGPFEGKTVVLAGRQFVDGKYVYSGPDNEGDTLFTYLHRCWEVIDVTDQAEALIPPAPAPQPDEIPNGNQTLGNQRLAEALRKLDPENDDHWTKLDKPAMAAVEQFYGSGDVTRSDVEAAIEGYDRAAARAAAAQATPV